jgi:manganese transport protein
MLGPAFVAAIAYVDPGNFATNFTAGSTYGMALLWVIVTANVVAVLVQILSAKLGLATGRNLPELCRERWSKRTVRALWLQAEMVAIATDLAEVIGGAIALKLLFDLPLLVGGLVTAGVSLVVLHLEQRGYRRFEVAVGVGLLVIVGAFCWIGFRAGIEPTAVAGGLVPGLPDADAVLLAAGIVGATVMPHVVYLHSDLTRRHLPSRRRGGDDPSEPEIVGTRSPRSPVLRRRLLGQIRLDVLVALGVAGMVNAAMLVIGGAVFFGGAGVVDTLEGVHQGLNDLIGGKAALLFAVALLASGIASAAVGTYAGQTIMGGFLQITLPLTVRRLVTVTPALIVLAIGIDPTTALVWSQVVLSFGIPFVLVPLILLTRDRAVMGSLVNRRGTTIVTSVAAALIIVLNVVLLTQTLT